MEKKKPWYLSKTIWANVVVLGVAIGSAIDSSLGTNIMQTPAVQVVLAIAGALGIYGRVTAKEKISVEGDSENN